MIHILFHNQMTGLVGCSQFYNRLYPGTQSQMRKSTSTPCRKFRKYFQMRQLSENMFQSFNMEVYEKIFFLVEFLVFQVSRENY